ncbi:efflux RND transporter periplasmic adaptor subunit [Cupriavidus sp. IDO]|uniref:efflux RND transporter periplasmic adaptor subunit n=1 Tax=Cupriavidus sp. IDO TaxID=1539142 RepID=UPI000579135F|nr:efflux transporter periplasmic adaptor subunit [Cupriavidus sp. IDO]
MKILSHRWRYPAIGFVASAMLAALAWHWSPSKAPQYVTTQVERRDLESVVLATGTLQACSQVDVGAQVSGQIKSMNVKLGDKIKKGQWLAEIDPVVLQNDLREKLANEQELVAQRRATAARLGEAELAFRRQQEMLLDDATSRQAYEAAQARLDEQRGTLASLNAKIKAAHFQVEIARAELSYTHIVAPQDGEVVALVAQEGQTVSAKQQAPVILKLADLDTMTVKAQISEADVVRVRPGQTVYFTILGDPDRRYYGKLRAIEPAPPNFHDAQSPPGATNSGASKANSAVFYNALFEVPNPGRDLRISMTAQVSVLLDVARQALSIPVAALGEKAPKGRYIVRVLGPDDKVFTREIHTGLNNNVMVEVREGLAEGERVVVGEAADISSDSTS